MGWTVPFSAAPPLDTWQGSDRAAPSQTRNKRKGRRTPRRKDTEGVRNGSPGRSPGLRPKHDPASAQGAIHDPGPGRGTETGSPDRVDPPVFPAPWRPSPFAFCPAWSRAGERDPPGRGGLLPAGSGVVRLSGAARVAGDGQSAIRTPEKAWKHGQVTRGEETSPPRLDLLAPWRPSPFAFCPLRCGHVVAPFAWEGRPQPP